MIVELRTPVPVNDWTGDGHNISPRKAGYGLYTEAGKRVADAFYRKMREYR